jgi:hypothetical protein
MQVAAVTSKDFNFDPCISREKRWPSLRHNASSDCFGVADAVKPMTARKGCLKAMIRFTLLWYASIAVGQKSGLIRAAPPTGAYVF